MQWYAASVIEYFEIIDEPNQDAFEVYENVYLVQAVDGDDAWAKAEEIGRAHAIPDESLRVGDRPARQVFGGVRKVIEMAPNIRTHTNRREVSVLEHGVEATYNLFVVEGRDRLKALIVGESVELSYEE